MNASAQYLVMKKAGALRNGAERGKGSIYHLVPPAMSKALCGATPAIMWTASGVGKEPTCPRCKRLRDAITRPDRKE